MRIMIISVDGEVIQSSLIVPKEDIMGLITHLTSLWWVREAYPIV